MNNIKIESLYTYEGAVYAVTQNNATGVEVFSSSNGTTWRQASRDGFGDINNFAALWSNWTMAYEGHLYIGVWNTTTGGELWRSIEHALYLPVAVH